MNKMDRRQFIRNIGAMGFLGGLALPIMGNTNGASVHIDGDIHGYFEMNEMGMRYVPVLKPGFEVRGTYVENPLAFLDGAKVSWGASPRALINGKWGELK